MRPEERHAPLALGKPIPGSLGRGACAKWRAAGKVGERSSLVFAMPGMHCKNCSASLNDLPYPFLSMGCGISASPATLGGQTLGPHPLNFSPCPDGLSCFQPGPCPSTHPVAVANLT